MKCRLALEMALATMLACSNLPIVSSRSCQTSLRERRGSSGRGPSEELPTHHVRPARKPQRSSRGCPRGNRARAELVALPVSEQLPHVLPWRKNVLSTRQTASGGGMGPGGYRPRLRRRPRPRKRRICALTAAIVVVVFVAGSWAAWTVYMALTHTFSIHTTLAATRQSVVGSASSFTVTVTNTSGSDIRNFVIYVTRKAGTTGSNITSLLTAAYVWLTLPVADLSADGSPTDQQRPSLSRARLPMLAPSITP